MSKGKAHRFSPAARLDGFDAPTVWQEFTPLAGELNAVNLGQGFPDWPSPQFLKDAAARAINEDHNQYCRSAGHLPLVQVLAEKYSAVLGREVDAMSEVTISVGATEAIFAIMQSLINPGDEVLLLEPAFDIYTAQAKMAGGNVQYVPLRPTPADRTTVAASTTPGADTTSAGSWTLDLAELEAALTDRTRIFVLNTPHNPTGKVFSEAELSGIAEVLSRYPDVVVVSDEVYEFMTYDGRPHKSFAAYPGMYDRCLTVSSAGKTFSVTGWKVGWVVGPPHLVKGVVLTNQWVQFSVTTPLQQAVAYAFEEATKPYGGHDSYYASLQATYAEKRKVLADALWSAGAKPYVPEGGFFIMADTSEIDFPEKYMELSTAACPTMTRDWAFCRWLAEAHGVVAIPPSAFYSKPNKAIAANFARFAFCKTDEAMTEASKRLAGVRKEI